MSGQVIDWGEERVTFELREGVPNSVNMKHQKWVYIHVQLSKWWNIHSFSHNITQTFDTKTLHKNTYHSGLGTNCSPHNVFAMAVEPEA